MPHANQQSAKRFSFYERKIKQCKLHLHLVTKDICIVFVFKQLFGDSSEQSEMFMSVVCIVTVNFSAHSHPEHTSVISVFELLNLREGRDPGGQTRICVPTLRKEPPV